MFRAGYYDCLTSRADPLFEQIGEQRLGVAGLDGPPEALQILPVGDQHAVTGGARQAHARHIVGYI